MSDGGQLKTYSVLIAWNDGQLDEGNFGSVVRAISPAEAEEKTRGLMAQSLVDDFYDEKHFASEEDFLSGYRDHMGRIGGSLQDLSEGASWKANDLETAIRDILSAWLEPGSTGRSTTSSHRRSARQKP